jgi:hypothetical protein
VQLPRSFIHAGVLASAGPTAGEDSVAMQLLALLQRPSIVMLLIFVLGKRASARMRDQYKLDVTVRPCCTGPEVSEGLVRRMFWHYDQKFVKPINARDPSKNEHCRG